MCYDWIDAKKRSSKKHLDDVNVSAASIVEEATGDEKNPAAVAFWKD